MDIVFPARGFMGFYPGSQGHKSRGRTEFNQALKALKDHGFEMKLEPYELSEGETYILPAFLVRISEIIPKSQAYTFVLHRLTVEQLGVCEPYYIGQKRPQGDAYDLVEMPQIEMWLPFPEMFIRLSIKSVWREPDTDDD